MRQGVLVAAIVERFDARCTMQLDLLPALNAHRSQRWHRRD